MGSPQILQMQRRTTAPVFADAAPNDSRRRLRGTEVVNWRRSTGGREAPTGSKRREAAAHQYQLHGTPWADL